MHIRTGDPTLYVKANQERNAYMRKWYANNRDRRKEYLREWRAKNADKVKEYNRNHWMRKAAEHGQKSTEEGR